MRTVLVAALAVALTCTAYAQDASAPAPNAAAPAAPTPAAPAPAKEAAAALVDPQQLSAEDQKLLKEAQDFYDSLNKQTGEVLLAKGKVKLVVPAGYYYLNPADSRRVIVDAWGNPPEAAAVEGMLFPAGVNPMMDSGWGATIEFAEDGYVSDKDAAKIDYAKLMSDMQKEAEAQNPSRVQDGYGALHLIGWAEQPHYDAATHKMYWAEELQFNENSEHTLNYKIRVLGREGVLVINFVSAMSDLPKIKAEAPAVMAIPTFTPGHTYADHAEGDRMAEYGLAGLVAGGLGLAAAKKLGLLGIILAFGKKFIVIIGAGLVALFGAVSKMFGKKEDVEAEPPPTA